MKRLIVALATVLLSCLPVEAAEQPLVVTEASHGAFPIVVRGGAAALVVDADDQAVVRHAAQDLVEDVAAVTGVRPRLSKDLSVPQTRHAIIVGTLDHSKLIDRLVRAGKLNVGKLKGAWESFAIVTVQRPAPGIESALVIVGSDRRGTAYGVYELSEAIGVSPWQWWADVPPRRTDTLFVPNGTRRFGPPSVRYRGIFLNDEDWGLFPWAAKTHEPDRGNIGPKTYERVFQLLLRLKANTLWPAMHKVSAPFNADPANARLADDYGIVMGSSHAEPMLRNNVGEWTAPSEAFDYSANPTGVRTYWQERAKTNGGYESLWTLGMRGIHDSGMVGPATVEDKVKLLSSIIADQREILRNNVSPDLSGVQQVFMPYKEVLELYRNGLNVPDDVTLMWPDDNFGYIRQFPSRAERARSGGAGVYYHLSYLGAPLSYLWLGTTPPALIQEEMTRAWDAGAQRIWIANVGDIKPSEISLSFFMEMAWDIDRWRSKDQQAFLVDWAERTFGQDRGAQIGKILDGHFRINFERRPEHLQWWLPGERPHRVPGAPFEVSGRYTMSSAEIDARLRRLDTLVQSVETVGSQIPLGQSDAFFELIAYPIKAAAAANRRFFGAERYDVLVDTKPAIARAAGAAAIAADHEIKVLTKRYNEEIAGGKWRYMLAEEPADNQWRDYRTVPVILPAAGLAAEAPKIPVLADRGVAPRDRVEAEQSVRDRYWQLLRGLGRGEGSVKATRGGATLTIRLEVPAGQQREVALGLLPLFPDEGDASPLRLAVSLDGKSPEEIVVPHPAGTPGWTQGVLDNLLTVPLRERLSAGRHDLRVTAKSSGIVLDQIILDTPLSIKKD